MNRREALLALTALPGLARISRADPKPDDVIVLECEKRLSDEQCHHLIALTQQVWPNRKVIVLEDGLKMKVVSQ